VVRGRERPRPHTGLDDDRRGGGRGDQSVTSEEAPAGGCRPGGDLADDRAAPLGDPGDQVAVPGGVGAVGSAGQPCDGGPARGERCAVSGCVDAVGGAADDDDAAACEVGGDLGGDVLAVAGGGARPDQGDPVGQVAGERGEGAARPDDVRGRRRRGRSGRGWWPGRSG
jgi:hypothetical protein